MVSCSVSFGLLTSHLPTTRTRCSQDPSGILGTLAEPTGTDGFPVLCHQFAPSSLSRRENCINSSTTFWLKMNKRREALLLFSSIGGQSQKNRQMVYPLQNGRLCCNVCLRRKNCRRKIKSYKIRTKLSTKLLAQCHMKVLHFLPQSRSFPLSSVGCLK